jgi:bacillopeptidase F
VSGTDAAGRPASASVTFRASTAEQETSSAAAYRWGVVKTAKAYGRSYLSATAKGSTLTTTFRGRAVTWYTMTGPGQGRATVFVDGVAKGKVNNWSTATSWHVARTVKGLKAGNHTLKVVVAGAKGATSGTGTAVAFDGLKVGKKLTASPRTTTTWSRVAGKAASGRAYAASAVTGSTAAFTFRGTSVTWVTARGPAMGKAKVYVDGVLKLTVDGYAKKAGWNVRRTLTGLGDRVHTVTVKVTGTKRRASTGTTVVVDRWLVG